MAMPSSPSRSERRWIPSRPTLRDWFYAGALAGMCLGIAEVTPLVLLGKQPSEPFAALVVLVPTALTVFMTLCLAPFFQGRIWDFGTIGAGWGRAGPAPFRRLSRRRDRSLGWGIRARPPLRGGRGPGGFCDRATRLPSRRASRGPRPAPERPSRLDGRCRLRRLDGAGSSSSALARAGRSRALVGSAAGGLLGFSRAGETEEPAAAELGESPSNCRGIGLPPRRRPPLRAHAPQ